MCGILFSTRFDSIPKQYTILEIKSLQNTTELAYLIILLQHIRFTTHSQSFNSIQTSDSSQKNIPWLFQTSVSPQSRKYWPKDKITSMNRTNDIT